MLVHFLERGSGLQPFIAIRANRDNGDNPRIILDQKGREQFKQLAAFDRTIGEEEFLALIDWKDDHWSFGRHFAHEPW